MSASILTNTSALTALTTLRNVSFGLETTQSRISTGERVSSAKDNAAYYAIASTMRGDSSSFVAMSENLALSDSTTAVAREGAEAINGLLRDIKSKIVLAQGDSVDKSQVQAEIKDLVAQVRTVSESAQFNGVSMLKSDTQRSFIASLNRANGQVSSSFITFNQFDLTDRAGINDTYIQIDAAAPATAGNIDVDLGGSTGDLPYADGDRLMVESVRITWNGEPFDIDVSSVDTLDEMAAAMQAELRTRTADNTIAIANNAGTIEFDGGTQAITRFQILEGKIRDAIMVYTDTVGTNYRLDMPGFSEGIDGEVDQLTVAGSTITTAGITSYVGLAEAMEDTVAGVTSAIYSSSTGMITFVTTAALGFSVDLGRTDAGLLRSLSDFDVTRDGGAEDALQSVDPMINSAVTAAQTFGSVQNRISLQDEFVKRLKDTLDVGIGALVDADMNAESARLQALQVQQQLAIQALSIANSQPENILSLFR